MERMIDSGIETLNVVGRWFCSHAWSVSVQVSILIVTLLVLDFLLRRRVRAVVRYAMWMLVFVKLLLPPTLSLPTGIGYYRPEHRVEAQKQTEPVPEEPALIADAQPVRQEPVVVPLLPVATVETPTPDVSRAGIIPAPAALAIVRPAVTWQGLVFLGWLTGVLALSVYLLRRVQYVRTLVGQSIPASDGLTDVLRECGTRLGLRSCPPLRLSDDAPGPAVCGLLRPVVLMPTSLAQTLSGERLRTVLVHELAHIKRADLWANFIQTLLLVVYFFHPLLWLAHAIVRRLREQAADETVLVALDAEAKSYSTTLIDLAETTFHRPALGLRLIGIAESKKALEGRIRHMITRPKPRTAKLGLCGLLVITITAAVLLPMARGETETGEQRFVARLPSGVTAELLGVCNWPTGAPVCWKPDGSPLVPPLRAKKSNVGPASDRYGFMLRVTGPDDRNMSWNKIEGASGWSGSCDVIDRDGKRLDDCTAAVANMKTGLDQTSLRVGFASGPWATISTHDGKGMTTGGGGNVLWSHAFNDSGTTCIVATAEWLKDRTERIIAIDKSGVTHTTSQGSVAMKNMDQMTARFRNVRPDQIKEFQYQVRPFAWVQFENVSLRPGHQTGVTVDPEATDELPPDIGRQRRAAPERVYSTRQLGELGKSLLIYANDHDDTFPDSLAEARDYIAENADVSWVLKNVTYLGRGVDPWDDPARMLAYDKTLLAKGKGTNVLFLDSHVEFVGAERFKELRVGKTEESLPNIFVMSSSRAGFDVFGEVLSRTCDWTWNKTGRHHSKESYDDIFDGTHNRTSHDILVLVFAWDADERIPLAYEDLLPMPWPDIEHELRVGRTVERSKEARGLHVILLAAPRGEPLKQLIARSKLLRDSRGIARSTATGCDVAIEDFKVRFDSASGKYAAIVSIRNRGQVASPKFVVRFYHNDPEATTLVSHGTGPIEPGRTWNTASRPFGLREGSNEVRVVLDPADLVQELDESNNHATLTVLIRDGRIARAVRHVVRDDQMPKPSITPAAESVSLEARVESATRLSDLGKAALIYANDHDDRLPDELIEIRPEYGVGFSWVYDNVAYLGQGVTARDRPERPIAYDKTLIQSGTGTNVLYLDSRVVFENPTRLEELDIRHEPKPKSAREVQQEAERQIRVTVMSHLKQLALAAIIYADDHDGTPADDLSGLKPYINNDALFAWAKENAEYVGQRVERRPGDNAFETPLIYWKNPPAAMNGTAMAFWDGHVEIVSKPKLDVLGSPIQR